MDNEKRIEELEAEVERLSHRLRTASDGARRGAGAGLDAWPESRLPVGRILLVVMAALLVGAALLVFGPEGFDIRQALEFPSELATQDIDYVLLACVLLGLMAVLFFAMRWRITFLSFALAATYLTYAIYFRQQPDALSLSSRDYFWLSSGFLTVVYLLFAGTFIHDVRRLVRGQRREAVLACVNSLFFVLLASQAVGRSYPESRALCELLFAAALVSLALLAETSGPHRNYLFQVFMGKAVLLATLALKDFLPEAWLLPAMAAECFVLAFIYCRTGVVAFKALNLLLLFITFGGALFAVRSVRAVTVGVFAVPPNWLSGLSVPGVFLLTAWLYEHFARRRGPEQRSRSGHWFLADTWLDVPGTATAILHAAMGALVLVTFTILEFGEDPVLPYVLAGESLVILVIGFLLRTPQIEVGSVLLLVATHVSYYFFLVTARDSFEEDASLVPYSLLVAAVTFFGAYQWERYLKGNKRPEYIRHDLVEATPYLLATAMLATLLGMKLRGVFGPLAQNALGGVLIVSSFAFGITPLVFSGMAAMAIGTGLYIARMYGMQLPLEGQHASWAYLVLILITYSTAERLLVWLPRPGRPPSKTEDALRAVLVFTAAALGAFAVLNMLPARHVALAWIGHALVGVVLGAVLRESRYRMAALLLLAGTAARLVAYDRHNEPIEWVRWSSVAAGVVFVVLIITWFYSLRKNRVPRAMGPDANEHE